MRRFHNDGDRASAAERLNHQQQRQEPRFVHRRLQKCVHLFKRRIPKPLHQQPNRRHGDTNKDVAFCVFTWAGAKEALKDLDP